MSNLTRAHQELYRRFADERFASHRELREHCQHERKFSSDCWDLPQSLDRRSVQDRVTVRLGDDGSFLMNDWSFSQLCRLSGVNKGTLNRLSSDTAGRALRETLPAADKPFQFLKTITDLLAQGVPLEDVQQLAGHADPRTTRLYDRRQRRVTRNIVEQVSV